MSARIVLEHFFGGVQHVLDLPPGTHRVTVRDDGTIEGPVRMRQAFRTASGKKKRSELWDTKMWVDDEDGARD